MKGVCYLTDNKNRKKAVVIDLKTLEKDEESIHEFIDVLVAESRKNDKLIDWEDAKRKLKKLTLPIHNSKLLNHKFSKASPLSTN